ncbi:hypothetical protein [Arthrobacter mangrovi]|nr:hypothetical protein [Arthrobacter mangrovi]
MTVALGSLPREQYGHASAIMDALQQLAGAACAPMVRRLPESTDH